MNVFDPEVGANQYHEIRDRYLKTKGADLVEYLDELVDLVEKSTFNIDASADHIWSRIWDKPLRGDCSSSQAVL